jgi:3-oxoacyl-[acyl-carrier protein] reductase
VPSGKKAALWSGVGRSRADALSAYATVENTVMGAILDKLDLWEEWKGHGELLWEAISHVFANRLTGEVHCFLEYPGDIFRQEHKILVGKADVTLKYHAVAEVAGGVVELGLHRVPLVHRADRLLANPDPGGRAIAVQADVGETEAVAAMFAEIEERLGRVAILVNNAGITRDDLLMRMGPEVWDEVIQTNLRSVYLCTRAAMRGMLRLKWGRIISLSSVSGISGNPGQANYAASKAAIIGFSKSVAREIGSRNITVNVVAPGFIETDMTEQLGLDVAEEVARRVALGRLGKPEEIAAAVGYLASDDAAYVTGQTLVVDGGLAL